MSARDGILDRRFYAVCEFERIDDLRGLLARAGLSVHRLKGRQLRMFFVAAALGGSPSELDEEAPVEVEIGRRDMRIGETLVRSLHLGKWPHSLASGFLQGLMAAGAPMDLSVHVGPIPTEQAARTLEWQKVRFESAQSLSFKRGRTMSPEAEIALEDITRLRDEVQRGRERLFHASLSVTLHAKDEASLKEMTQRAKAHFAATLGKLDNLAFRQREGLLSTLPLALNAVAEWRSLDTSSIARLFPFSPPDLDTRSGTLYGIDMRACSPVVYDPWDGTHLNANTAVLARSGSGKSFATKLGVLRGLTRGVTAYVIDPEGEYADMARAAGGRVLSPGVPGEGMNPFVIDKGDSEELLQRIGSLRRLIEVMVGGSLGAERRASLDHALAVEPYADDLGDVPLLANVPEPGTIAAEERIESIGAVKWTLSNGITVIAKQTDFRDDEVLFRAFSPGGHSLVTDEEHLSARYAAQLVAGSGAGPHESVTLDKLLAGKRVTVAPYIEELFEGFSGNASPEDLETLFQLITLHTTEHRLDPDFFTRYEARLHSVAEFRAADPDSVFFDYINTVLSQGHHHGRPLSFEVLEELNMETAEAVYSDRFADLGDATFVFVGAFDWDTLRSLTTGYLAALPSAGRAEEWCDVGLDPRPRAWWTKWSAAASSRAAGRFSCMPATWTGAARRHSRSTWRARFSASGCASGCARRSAAPTASASTPAAPSRFRIPSTRSTSSSAATPNASKSSATRCSTR